MTRYHKVFYFIGLMVLGMGSFSPDVASAKNDKQALPSYSNGVKEVDKQLYSGKNAIVVDDHDMAVMTKAAADLASQMPNPGLHIGDKAPDFTLKDPFGKSVTLSTYLKKGPVILVFYRGAWCPYCNLQMHQYIQSLPAFKKYGASIIAVTPQTPDKSKDQFKKDGYKFKVLSDPDYRVIKLYNLYWEVSNELDAAYKHAFVLDISSFNGKDRLGLPVPGTFVIDKKGIIRAAFANTDYKKRMEPSDILAALKIIHKMK